MKILHVIKWFGMGGVETWLINVLRNIDRERYSIDIMVQDEQPGIFDDEAKSLGARILYCSGAPDPVIFAKKFLKIIKQNGPYDVVHSHVHHFSGYILTLASIAGIKGRIAHCHSYNVTENLSIKRKAYLKFMKILITCFATQGFAVSGKAAEDLFGVNWKQTAGCQIYPCAIDCKQFTSPENKDDALRGDLGLPEEAIVIGHVGRFTKQKNHDFLIDIVADHLKNNKDCYLLLVGCGPLQRQVEQKTEELGIRDKVVFAGIRHDVANIMKSIIDVFLFPSVHEGLGLVLVEAQAAGLPCLVSDTVPAEACILSDLITRCSLSEDKKKWQQKLDFLLKTPSRIRPEEAVNQLLTADLPYCIDKNVKYLQQIYQQYEF